MNWPDPAVNKCITLSIPCSVSLSLSLCLSCLGVLEICKSQPEPPGNEPSRLPASSRIPLPRAGPPSGKKKSFAQGHSAPRVETPHSRTSGTIGTWARLAQEEASAARPHKQDEAWNLVWKRWKRRHAAKAKQYETWRGGWRWCGWCRDVGHGLRTAGWSRMCGMHAAILPGGRHAVRLPATLSAATRGQSSSMQIQARDAFQAPAP